MLRFWLAYIVYYWGAVHRYFGNVNNVRREYELAVYYFDKAYGIDPTFRGAHLQKAILLWRELGQLDEALHILNDLLIQDPKDGEALMNRALIRQEQGKFQAALSDMELYLRLPQDDRYWDLAVRTVTHLREVVSEVG